MRLSGNMKQAYKSMKVYEDWNLLWVASMTSNSWLSCPITSENRLRMTGNNEFVRNVIFFLMTSIWNKQKIETTGYKVHIAVNRRPVQILVSIQTADLWTMIMSLSTRIMKLVSRMDNSFLTSSELLWVFKHFSALVICALSRSVNAPIIKWWCSWLYNLSKSSQKDMYDLVNWILFSVSQQKDESAKMKNKSCLSLGFKDRT